MTRRWRRCARVWPRMAGESSPKPSPGLPFAKRDPKPHTPHPKPHTSHPTPHTPNPKPQTPNPKPQTPYPTPHTPHPTPHTPHPTPQTPNAKRQSSEVGWMYITLAAEHDPAHAALSDEAVLLGPCLQVSPLQCGQHGHLATQHTRLLSHTQKHKTSLCLSLSHTTSPPHTHTHTSLPPPHTHNRSYEGMVEGASRSQQNTTRHTSLSRKNSSSSTPSSRSGAHATPLAKGVSHTTPIAMRVTHATPLLRGSRPCWVDVHHARSRIRPGTRLSLGRSSSPRPLPAGVQIISVCRSDSSQT